MFVSVLIVYQLLHKRLKFLQEFRHEILCISTAGANIAKYRNIYKSTSSTKTKFIVY